MVERVRLEVERVRLEPAEALQVAERAHRGAAEVPREEGLVLGDPGLRPSFKSL